MDAAYLNERLRNSLGLIGDSNLNRPDFFVAYNGILNAPAVIDARLSETTNSTDAFNVALTLAQAHRTFVALLAKRVGHIVHPTSNLDEFKKRQDLMELDMDLRAPREYPRARTYAFYTAPEQIVAVGGCRIYGHAGILQQGQKLSKIIEQPVFAQMHVGRSYHYPCVVDARLTNNENLEYLKVLRQVAVDGRVQIFRLHNLPSPAAVS